VLYSWCVGFDPTSSSGHDHCRPGRSVGGSCTGQVSWSPGVGGDVEVAAGVRVVTPKLIRGQFIKSQY